MKLLNIFKGNTLDKQRLYSIYSNFLYKKFLSVEQLAIYWPGEQSVYFQKFANNQKLQKKFDRARFTLMAFFDYNSTHGNG